MLQSSISPVFKYQYSYWLMVSLSQYILNAFPEPILSLSFELTKLLPVQSAISHTAESLISLARELRRSGSDILVEEDLAAVFGRGKIDSPVETQFKDVVKVTSFTPLHSSSEIV